MADSNKSCKRETCLSIVIWLSAFIFFITTTTTSKYQANTADQQISSAHHRSRRSIACSCCDKKSTNNLLMVPTRIPYGRPRKVLSFLRMVRRGLKITYRRRGMLYCKNGFILRIGKTGSVGGTTRYSDPYSKLEFQSVGMGLVRVRGYKSGRYLAINQHGTLYTTPTYNKDSIFEEKQEENFYHSFISHRYDKLGWYVALRRNGQVKKTAVLQKATQFLVLFS